MDYLENVRAKMGIRVDKPPAAAAGADVAVKKTNGKRTLDPPPGRAKPPAVALCKCELCGLANDGDRVGRRKGVVPPAGEPTFHALVGRNSSNGGNLHLPTKLRLRLSSWEQHSNSSCA